MRPDPTVDPRVARREQQRAREREALDVGTRLARHLSRHGIGWDARPSGLLLDTTSAGKLADLLDRLDEALARPFTPAPPTPEQGD